MTTDDLTPTLLRERIAADLRPVRPLLEPWKRALVLAPLGLLLLVVLPVMVFHIRTDVERLSPVFTWGLSIIQVAVGIGLAGGAFRLVVPGRWFGSVAVTALLVFGVSATIAVMWTTWSVSPVRLPDIYWRESTVACLTQSFLDGLPFLAVCLLLAARGLAVKPAAVGALAGLGAGIVSDAAWRMVCVVTQPSHVFLGHLGAVLALSVAGAVLMSAWCRVSRRS